MGSGAVMGTWAVRGTGATMGGCPYGDYDNAVNVVGHDVTCVDINARIMPGDVIPYGLDQYSGVIKYHCTINNVTEETLSGLGT